MQPHSRYEPLEKIAAGDFATVFRARDHELARDVAIKQIHPQYLEDPAQLARYWQEAQLLASLQHPYIVSIYDIVRDRGWVILELMKGGLSDRLQGEPIELDYLRVTLGCVLHALHFLEQNGIVHGDVKPSNLLLDHSNRIKLGDFSIARRLASGDGSVVKGTTKYIAPEVLSDQFGPVGPHSDLYSLGFSAYELMCGANFQQLFPGMSMYGRDPQVAWMMWHSAVDRRLPEVNRVLEGVPDDLAAVIQRMIEKDPDRRYRSAQAVLADLRSKGQPPAPPSADSAGAPAAAPDRTKRWLTIAAVVVSVCLSLGMLLLPSGTGPHDQESDAALPTAGVVRVVDTAGQTFNIKSSADGQVYAVQYDPAVDRIEINGRRAELAEVPPGSSVAIERLKNAQGRTIQIISISPATDSGLVGKLKSVEPAVGELLIETADGETQRVYVPEISMELNGRTTLPRGGRVRLADLKPGDDLQLTKISRNHRLEATSLSATRKVTEPGVVVRFNTQQNTLTYALSAEHGSSSQAVELEFPVAADAVFTLNGETTLAGRELTLADLKPNDLLEVTRDTAISRLAASRTIADFGVVEAVDPAARTLRISLLSRQGRSAEFHLAEDAVIKLRDSPEQLALADLRPDDRVSLAHHSLNLDKPAAASRVMAALTPDRRTTALLIAPSEYDDPAVPAAPHAAADAERIRLALVGKYRAPAEQVHLVAGRTRSEWETEIAAQLAGSRPDSQLIVYFAGRAYLAEDGSPILAPPQLDRRRVGETALPLAWLLQQMEQTPARRRLLLIDCDAGGASGGANVDMLPLAAGPLAEALVDGAERPLSKSVTVVTSCAAGESSQTDAAGAGRFSLAVARAFSGAADADGDRRVSVDELFAILPEQLKPESSAGVRQTPRLFPPGEDEYFSPAATAAVRALANYLSRDRLTRELPPDLERIRLAAAEQPEVRLLEGLILLRARQTATAAAKLEPLKRELLAAVRAKQPPPKTLPALHVLAWQNFLRNEYTEGVGNLQLLVSQMPAVGPDGKLDDYFAHVLTFAGVLRQFARDAAEPPLGQAETRALDEAVLAHSPAAREHFRRGVEIVRDKLKDLDARLKTAAPTEATKLKLDRRRLTYYTSLEDDHITAYMRSLVAE